MQVQQIGIGTGNRGEDGPASRLRRKAVKALLASELQVDV
jgi:hypothetical protein